MNLSFDDALDSFVAIVRKHGVRLGHADGILRDVYGRLTLFRSEPLAEQVRDPLTVELAGLVPYVRPDRVVVVQGEPGADEVLSETRVQWLRIPRESIDPIDFVRVIERRVVGADWMARPQEGLASGARRFVFASMKGGVGRTTALCVAASELARRGQRVLVVDLDLEAPGAGAMLAASLPKLGMVDVLAADAVGGNPDLNLDELTIARRFDQGEFLHIVPAYGSSSLDRPENYLAKLARAVADVAVSDPRPLHTRVSQLLDRLCAARAYDVVLIDARAGLAEVTAGAVLTLGATVFLFGTAQQQTFDDYRFLFAHLRSLAAPDGGAVWKNLVPVLAKAGKDEAQLTSAQTAMYDLFVEYLYEEQDGDAEVFNYDERDPEAPHRFVPIAFDATFATFDPQRRETDLTAAFYEQAFAPFLDTLWRCAGLGKRADR